jgi:hypothetical protein
MYFRQVVPIPLRKQAREKLEVLILDHVDQLTELKGATVSEHFKVKKVR